MKDFSIIQIIALCIITTILTDKFIVSHNQTTPTPAAIIPQNITVSPQPSPVTSPTTVPANTQNELILKEIQNLRKDMNTTLNNIQTKTTTQDVGPTLTSSLIGGMVKISSPQWKRVDVYEKASTSSKIINSIAYDAIYFYTTKNDSWYQLNLDGGQSGWVQSQFLKEYP